MQWQAYLFSSLFILGVATESQMDNKLFSVTYNLCSKKIVNIKIEGSPLFAPFAFFAFHGDLQFQTFVKRLLKFLKSD